ncbi:MAG: hypothetical protein ACRCY3_03610 [Sphingorhabdus sp.]
MATVNNLPEYDDPDLAAKVERLTDDEIDVLPFGAIRLSRDRKVEVYNRTEREQSGWGDRERIGRDFFAEMAPCMNNDSFRGRIDRAIEAGMLDLEFGHVGDFSDRERELNVRVQSSSTGGYWLFFRRIG